MSTNSFMYVDPGPPPALCVTVKTNQISLPGTHVEPGQSGTWTGPGGGSGTHNQYEYLVNQANELLEDQYIVMSNWNSTAFVEGEDLTLAP